MSKKPQKRKPSGHDPFAAREAKKYADPIPSREFILARLVEAEVPLSEQEIRAALDLDAERQGEAVRRRLRAMVRDGQLVQTRKRKYAPLSSSEVYEGRVVGHPEGFGFVILEGDNDDLFLSPQEMRKVFHNDKVLVQAISTDRRGRTEGRIAKVLSHNTQEIVGRFITEHGVHWIVPDNRKITHDISVSPQDTAGAKEGQIVIAEIISQPAKNQRPVARITEVLGVHMAPGMEIEVALRAHAIPHRWPDDILAASKKVPKKVTKASYADRKDLRDLPLVTIDGSDAKDFDDAVYCERRTLGGWRLYVAIADVSHYVQPGSALDTEANARGNSVYFPGKVVPMLPPVLSNGICSLNPDVDRLCMVCEMTISRKGKVTRSKFYEAVMHSHARLTYNAVAKMVVDKDKTLRAEHADIVPHLENLHGLYKALRKGREARGAIDFETIESRIIFDNKRKIKDIKPVVRNDAHKMIEECMLLANVCAAKFLLKHKVPALYRNHTTPAEDSVAALREFLHELGLQLRGGEVPEPKHYAQVLKQIADRPDAHLIQMVLLRSLNQAVYSADNAGHFGLAFEAYAHFTSPIRRYPDLLVHRAIRYVLYGEGRKTKRIDKAVMDKIAEHSCMTERRADDATRDATNWLKCEYMQDRVGEVFEGTVAAVTGFGVFVSLNDIFVEGLVHITQLKPSDYYRFNATHHYLEGELTGQRYSIGDPMKVRVVRVDLDERKIDFDMVVDGEPEKKRAHKPRKKNSKKTTSSKTGKPRRASKTTKTKKK